jgi:hypothetical protein
MVDESRIDEELKQFIDSMTALNLTVTDEEVEQRRALLLRQATGEDSALAVPEGNDVESFEDALALASQPDSGLLVLDDFRKLDDKSKLEGVPFVAQRWWFTNGEMGEFAVVRCLLPKDNPIYIDGDPTNKVIITDGSTGIYKQLRELSMATGQNSKLVVRHGLRASDYTADTDQGPKLARTYYLT